MPVDINQPVEPGHDVVINFEDGRQELGTSEDRQAAVDQGQVIGEHSNGVPVPTAPAVPDQPEEGEAVPDVAEDGDEGEKEEPEQPEEPETPAPGEVVEPTPPADDSQKKS